MRAPIAVLALVACSQPPLKDPAPSPRQTTFFVDPLGSDDSGTGTRELPLRSIAAALLAESVERVVIAPGSYAENDVVVTRPVELFGPGDGRATLEGHLAIESHGVVVHGLDVARGVVIRSSNDVSLSSAKLASSSSAADTLLIERSWATLSDLTLECGIETCLNTRDSTVAASRLSLFAAEPTKRGLRVASSSVSATAIEVSGGAISQVQAELGAHLTLTESKLLASQGNGLVVLSRAAVFGRDVEVRNAADSALLVSSAEVSLARSAFLVTASGITVGIQGSRARLQAPKIEGSIYGALSVGKYRDQTSNVEIDGGTIDVGLNTGILLAAGRLTLRAVEITGSQTRPSESDAIVASSEESSLELVSSTISFAGAWAVASRDSANLTISSSRIVRPALGGVLVDESPGGMVRVRDLSIEGPLSASGMAIFGAKDAVITGARITASAEAGILAGASAPRVVDSASLENNVLYGVAAFGASLIELSRSTIRGSPWAAFASCGDGSAILDVDANALEGQTSLCP